MRGDHAVPVQGLLPALLLSGTSDDVPADAARSLVPT